MIKFHAYCGGELRVVDGTFCCSNCGITGTVERTPNEITLADVRVLTDREPIVTDREIQIVSYATQDPRLQLMLRELLDLRRGARKVVSEYDLCPDHRFCKPPAIQLGALINRAGCQWFQCTAHAHTQRVPKDRISEAWHLCHAHADEGETKGMWDEQHPANVQWRQDAMFSREAARKRTLEMIAEDHGTDEAGARP